MYSVCHYSQIALNCRVVLVTSLMVFNGLSSSCLLFAVFEVSNGILNESSVLNLYYQMAPLISHTAVFIEFMTICFSKEFDFLFHHADCL